MAKPSQQSIGQAPARAITGPTVGWADDTVSTSAESVDLSEWAGLRVRIEAEGDVVYFAFGTSSDTLQTGSASVGTAAVAQRVSNGGWRYRVVPKDRPVLHYKAKDNSGVTLRVTV